VLRGFLFLLFLSANALAGLPAGAIVDAVQVDRSGNIYVAGQLFSNPADQTSPFHAFAGKLSPDGSQTIWWTLLAGSQDENVTAIALAPDNSVYLTGGTSSLDFPTTPGSMQPTTSISGQAFAAKLNPQGVVVYSTFIGGKAGTGGGAIAVDSSGDAFVTGYILTAGAFPTTPGAVTGGSISGDTGFVVELNPQGSAAVVSLQGFGGSAIAVDAQNNIYAAGNFSGENGPNQPTTPGAFQTAVHNASCFSSFILNYFCGYQHIAKIDPTGTKLIYGTYIAGSYGASLAGMAVDADGNAIVAGSTNSPDYPTTPGAYQPQYFSNPEVAFDIHEEFAPAPAGYVTKLNASGTGLIWSTFFGGSSTQSTLPVVDLGSPGGDSITGMAVDANGNILIAGIAQSSDLPGLWLTPVASRPAATGEGFVTRLSPDGTTLSPTELIPTNRSAIEVAAGSDGSAVIGFPLTLVSISAVGRVAAICDTADNAKIVRVAPGQLLTLYGANLALAGSASGANGFPTALSGVTVTFNGIAAPLLYTSSVQINLQVPYEIAGLPQVTMQVSSSIVSPPVSESYILAVAERQPSVFISAASVSQPIFNRATCNGQNIAGLQPLALNADGTENSCVNPAASGSVVTIFLNGLGVSAPMQATGMVSTSAVAINPTAGSVSGTTNTTNFSSTSTVPGSIDSIARVQIQVSSTGQYLSLPLEVEQQPGIAYWVRGPGVLIWVQQ
jgi:uncharacterized protein (TIGR03437 family)